MHRDYLCPNCQGHLNVGGHIVFTVVTPRGVRGLMLLSPELGDYRTIHHPSLRFQAGDRVEFLCPICHTNLTASEFHQNLARIVMVDEDGTRYDVIFSEIAGEKCTYKIGNNEIEEFGENAPEYTNYFGERRMQRT